MKTHDFILAMGLFVTCTSGTQAQKIGINTLNPQHSVHITQPPGETLVSNASVVQIEYTGTNAQNVNGLNAKSRPSEGYGVGGVLEGGFIGVVGQVISQSGDHSTMGVRGRAFGSGMGGSIGVIGEAGGLGVNYGVYANALGGTNNFAGYFDGGDVYIDNRLGIGTLNPLVPLHVEGAQGTGRLVSLTSTNGSVLDLRNLAESPTFIGALNFSNTAEGSTPGQIAYLANHNITFRVNQSERMRLTADGRLGLGTTAPVSGLEIFRAQSTVRLVSTNAPNGSVLELGCATEDPNYIGAVNWVTTEGTPGQIGYLGDHSLTFRSNFFERMRISPNGFLGLGTTNPLIPIHVVKPEAFIRLTSTAMTSGSVIELRNDMTGAEYLGGMNFSTSGQYAIGQVGYLANHTMVFRVNGGERMRITSTGLTGIGRTPATNRLEVEGNASKSSAGDWLANSDARLKKNIQPLESREMLDKLLALKGVTYEWNDDKTGTTRPEGTHYGFTAQNIQEVFPTLVEEDALGYLQTAYGTYDAMMVEALRALNEKILDLQDENSALKAEISSMKNIFTGSIEQKPVLEQ